MPTRTFGPRHAQSTSHAMRCSRHPHSTAAVPFQSTATRWALYDEPDDGTPALGAYDPKDPNIPTFEDKMAKPAGFGGHSTAGTFGSDRSAVPETSVFVLSHGLSCNDIIRRSPTGIVDAKHSSCFVAAGSSTTRQASLSTRGGTAET